MGIIKDKKSYANQLFSKFSNEIVTKVLISYKGCATIDFGKDLTVEVKTNRGIKQFTRGEWCFWLYACSWRLEQDNQPLVGSGDSSEGIQQKLPLLEGKKILQVEILNDAFDLLMHFEKGLQLFVFSDQTEDAESWTLSTPDCKVFTTKSDE